MQLGFALLIFALGLIVGSFLNVLVFRLNTGESAVRGRSRCFSCGRKLTVVDLIPIFSFLIQRGRCRSCGSKISIQYLLVELVTGLMFVLVVMNVVPNFQFSIFNFQSISNDIIFKLPLLLIIFSLLIAISVYDLRHMIIPNQFVYPFIILALLASIPDSNFQILTSILSGLGAFGFFAGLWLVSKGRWMGFGDAKLALGIGFLLGPLLTPLVVMLAFWLGVLISVPIVLKRGGGLKTQVPFGPFLVLATILSWYAGTNILSWYLSFF